MPHPRVRATAKQLGDRHFQINLSSKIALITQTLLRTGKNNRKVRVKAGYFGFSTHDEAIAFANSVRSRFPKARLEVRQAKRLATAFEVKVSHDCIEQLAWDFLWNHPTVSEAIAQHNTFYGKRAEGIAHHAMQFVVDEAPRFEDRSTAPLQSRSSASTRKMATVGRFTVGIE